MTRSDPPLPDLHDTPPAVDELEAARLQQRLRESLFGMEVAPLRLDRFVVLERIGAGAMGAVYSAYDPRLDRKVAIKVLHASGDVDDTANARLVREARALAKLDHPNVVRVHEVGTFSTEAPDGTETERVFVAMEFVAGQTLTQWLSTERTRAEILPLFIAAGRGLAAAHAAGLVHRDFKPDNVLVAADGGERGPVRVVDFGLARLPSESAALGTETDPRLDAALAETALDLDAEIGAQTATGAVLGTPAYMAPEQHQGEVVTGLSDQFSFCVALYEALTGTRPFEGKTRGAVLAAIEAGKISGGHDGEARLPIWLRRALLRGLAVDPLARWPSLDALVAHLDRDRRRRWWAAAAVVATVGASAAVIAAQPQDADPCAAPRQAVADVYNGEVASAVSEAFTATPVPAAAEVAAKVDARLAAYVHGWWTQRQAACTAAPQDPEAVAQGDCLDAELSALGAVVEVFLAADQDTVRGAFRMTPDVADLQRCRIVADRSEDTPDPEVNAMLARAEATSRAGKRDDALSLAYDALAEARHRGNAASEGRALVRAARTMLALRRHLEGLDLIHRAVAVAERAGDDVTRADALRAHVSLLNRLGRNEEAEQVATLAAAALERFPDHPVTWDVELEEQRAVMAEAGRDYETAIEHLNRAKKRLDSGNVSPIHHAILLDRLSQAHRLAGHNQRALEFQAQARAVLLDAYGEHHPGVASSWVTSAAVMHRLNDIEGAEQALHRALQLKQRLVTTDDDPSLAAVLCNLGGLLAAYDAEQAEGLLRRGRRATVASRGKNHRNVLSVDLNLAIALEMLGRDAEASVVVDTGIARMADVLAADDIIIPRLQALAATSHIHQGLLDQAKFRLDAAVQGFALQPKVDTRYTSRVECGLARVALGSDPELARQHAQQCYTLSIRYGRIRWRSEAAMLLVLAGRAAGQPAEEETALLVEANAGRHEHSLPPKAAQWLSEQLDAYGATAHAGP